MNLDLNTYVHAIHEASLDFVKIFSLYRIATVVKGVDAFLISETMTRR